VGRPPPVGVTARAFEARRARTRTMLEAVAQQTGAQLLQPADVLCVAERCTIVHEGEALYYDDNHLNLAGATYVQDSLLPIVE